MPKWAARLFLEITDIRVERVQDISEDDAKAEGVSTLPYVMPYDCEPKFAESIPVWRFRGLWNRINAKRGYGWDSNLWCWVIEFRRTNV
jgi:hypothetical protein